MTPDMILYPCLIMFLLTLSLLVSMGLKRRGAVLRREVHYKYYELYQSHLYEEPEHLRLLHRHVQNHFEMPPLFYVAVLIAFVTNTVSVYSIAFAWLFVIARVLHSLIHLRGNKVPYRFQIFAVSLLALLGLWLSVFIPLLLR